MIRSFRDARTRRLFEGETVGGFRGMDRDRADNRLAMLDAATSLSDLSPLRSVGLHPLKGSLKGFWAMTINARWRLVFSFRDGDAYDVFIDDYHKG